MYLTWWRRAAFLLCGTLVPVTIVLSSIRKIEGFIYACYFHGTCTEYCTEEL